jgi:N-acetylglucosaminyl-diphospho-decaprenol L-rhamnosyltransferase
LAEHTVEAVVVDHASGDLLRRCIRSLALAGASRVVVVDNAVPPGRSAEVLESLHGGLGDTRLDLVETGVNVGYGAGANRGVATCSAEVVLVCNPDLVVDVSALSVLADALSGDRGLAIVGPEVLDADGKRYPSARRFPDLVEGAGHALAGLVSPDNRFSRRYRMTDLSPHETTRVDWVSGSFMLVRRSAFEDLGGFDEEYFMYAEDVDICWRAHRAGWGVAYVPAASVTHLGAVSTRSRPYRMLVAHHRSTLRFASRSLSGPRRVALPAIAVALSLRLVAEVAAELAARLVAAPAIGAVKAQVADD